jgi:uncharacterized membrane protein
MLFLILKLLIKIVFYGSIGMLIECWFTGIASLIKGDRRLQSVTYLWMAPIYAFSGITIGAIVDNVHIPFYLMGFLLVPVFYGIEFLSGFALLKLIKHIPWDYGRSKWTPMGLINFKYFPFWLLLAIFFGPISSFVEKVSDGILKIYMS